MGRPFRWAKSFFSISNIRPILIYLKKTNKHREAGKQNHFQFYDQDKVIQRKLLSEVENLDVNIISGRSLFN